ncbi:MAG: F0F1 ATP synthase subunit epsilon [Rhodobacteraceae bacterium]|nr:MAG: F0F1 ATP synthase subunit epsilon [Paracoccaceae bacterium]
MPETMQFDLVSPERKLASGQVRAVQIPGADGDMTAMPDHAPTITTLRPGILVTEGAEGATRYVVTGGFADITPEATSVLAERAYGADAEGRAALEAILAETHDKAASLSGPEKDAMNKVADDLARTIDTIG